MMAMLMMRLAIQLSGVETFALLGSFLRFVLRVHAQWMAARSSVSVVQTHFEGSAFRYRTV